MDVQEFKEKYPHLSHLEGNDLWNAMEQAVFSENPPPENEPVLYVETIERDGYTFHIHVTQSMIDFWKPFEEQAERIKKDGLGPMGLTALGRRRIKPDENSTNDQNTEENK